MSKPVKSTFNHHHVHHSFNDEPAVIWPDGTKSWYNNGKRHRETGAAIIWSDGTKSYFLNGVKYPFHEWLQLTPLSNEQKIELALEHE